MSANREGDTDQRLDVLRQIPPLLPLFLSRRRAVIPEIRDLVGRLCEQLDIERPLFFTMVGLHELQGGYNWQPLTLAQIRARDPYRTIDNLVAPMTLLEQKGLLVRDSEDRLSLSPEARETVDGLHRTARDYIGSLRPLPPGDLDALVGQLEWAVEAILHDLVLAPRPGSHLACSRSLAQFGPDVPPMVRIEQAIFDLWMARDDAHIKAWQEAGLEGPAVEVLTLLWMGECGTASCLAEKLKESQTPESIDLCLDYLAESGYIERGPEDRIDLTPAGVVVRTDIERETDRIYFDPWPQSYEEADQVRVSLGKLVENLQPPSRGSAEGKAS